MDEFYKASEKFDKERAASLIKAIIKLGSKAKQKYFLAPNISAINKNILTKDMEFLRVDFNTIYLDKHELYKTIDGNEDLKSDYLLKILNEAKGKTLIYAGTYSNIDKVANLLIDDNEPVVSDKLRAFERWLTINYDRNWHLTNLVKRGCGIHNGQMHRSLSQIQVKLFEEEDGLKNIVSTSSIIEGVNTSAENVIIWRNRNGTSRLNDFTYKNIIGRSGRMFKHFIGKVYILEEPPIASDVQLDLSLPDSLLGGVDDEYLRDGLTQEQIAKIISFNEEMSDILGADTFASMKRDNVFESSNSYLIRDIARDISGNPEEWNGLGYLNSNIESDWDRFLFKAINFHPGGWGIEYGKFVEFIKILSGNWSKSIPMLLRELDQYDIGVDDFFKLERNVTFKLAATLNDINIIQKKALDKPTDISPFISKLSHSFLPPLVYQLEEYGLPRMVSKKIHFLGIIDFEDETLELHDVIERLKLRPIKDAIMSAPIFSEFDRYIISYFYEGV